MIDNAQIKWLDKDTFCLFQCKRMRVCVVLTSRYSFVVDSINPPPPPPCCYSLLYFPLRSAAASDAPRRVVYVA